MKLSFSTLGCPSWSLERVLDVAGREGYDGVELRFLEDDDALWARPELSGGGLGETRRRLRGAVLTPHVGSAQADVRRQMADVLLSDLERFARGRPVRHRVTAAMLERMT